MKNKIYNYIDNLKKVLDSFDVDALEKVIKLFIFARDNKKTIYVFGNGGSGSTASHMVCDIIKGCSYEKEKKFKIICLNDNIPTILAYSNDVSYDIVFEEQLKNLMSKDDVVLAISGSGNSENIIRAVDYANTNGAITIGFSGFNGGLLKKKAKVNLHVPINDMQISEDFHVIAMHIMYTILSDS
tara:strand:- start:154 stop:708 length:555 start_codon:yes stop_codon:yes gene_type:complete